MPVICEKHGDGAHMNTLYCGKCVSELEEYIRELEDTVKFLEKAMKTMISSAEGGWV